MVARTWKYLIASGGLVLTAACADDRAPNVTMPGGVSAVVVSPSCDFTQMKKDARAYFVSSQDPVYDLMQQFASLNKTGPAGTFKQKGYEILARVGSVAGTTAVTTPAAGDAFVGGVFICIGFTPAAGTFTAALGANGLFAVRGNSFDAVLSRGSPKYGAEPTTKSWKESASLPPGVEQLVLYGFPRNVDTFTSEPGLISTGYELFTIPAGLSFPTAIVGGVCLLTVPTQARLLHEHNGVDEILAPVTPGFCAGVPAPQMTRAPNESPSVLALVHRVSDWFAPKPLYAATMVIGGMGGSLGGLSPIGPVLIDASTVTLAFVQQPSNGSINQPITPTITVSAATAAGTPLDGVFITLTAVGNSGGFTLSGNTATTKDGGIATFPLFQTDKAGGYTISANGTIAGSATKTATSVLFNVNGQ